MKCALKKVLQIARNFEWFGGCNEEWPFADYVATERP